MTWLDAVSLLENPSIKAYILNLLRSERQPEAMHQTLVSLFESLAKLDHEIAKRTCKPGERPGETLPEVVAGAAQAIGLWKPDEILAETSKAVTAALSCIIRRQHQDHGWGYLVEQSSVWGTAQALLALYIGTTALGAASAVDASEVERCISQGVDWLLVRRSLWSPGEPSAANRPLYESCLAIRTLAAVRGADDGLLDSARGLLFHQNQDNGWDATLWGSASRGSIRVWSEVGATSLAVQALSPFEAPDLEDAAQRGLTWLLEQQNDDGSWSGGTCAPGCSRVSGTPLVTKTCDAITAIRAQARLHPESEAVKRAITWIIGQERLDAAAGSGLGWGFSDLASANPPPPVETTCITMEALLVSDGVALPLLSANARRLISCQVREAGHPDDGAWRDGDTFRITRGICEYYRRIRLSPLFNLPHRPELFAETGA